MAFWGIEVKPGEPYIHQYDDERGRLHLSQATIIPGSSKKRTVVQCSVGDEKPIQLCSLLPEKLETCTLNLEFEEHNNVTFSVLGPHSVHLSGFFYGCDDKDQDNSEDEYLNNLYGEDIMVTDSEDKDYSEDEDEHGDCSDDDCCLYHSPVRKSGVRIEEIVEEKPTNENGISKQAKKKKGQLSMSNDIVKTRAGVPILESEDEDGFPKSSRQSKSDDTENDRIGVEIQKQDKDHKAQVKISKRKIDDVGQDGEFTRENIEPHDPVQPDTVIPENEVKRKKKNKNKNKNKKKKVAEKEENAQESGMLNSNGMEQSPVAEIKNDLNPISKEKKEKTKKPNKKESAATPITEEKSTDKKGSVIKKQNKAEEANKSLQVRSFPNGLEIEELAMGKPDGKRASPGKKVSVHYIGKLKKNNKTFDSNIGRAPFKFHLGIGEVIKGWDVGVNGMRVGDKRRLTIPPAMGYGAKGCGPAIPPNSWLVFQVELVDVN